MESSSALKRKASSSLALVYVKKSAPLDNLNPRSQSITVGSDQDEGENEKRFNDATLEVRQRQKVTIAIPPKNFDFVLSLPKVSGRKCTMKSLGPKGQNYKLIIIESGTTSFLADIKKYGKGYLSQLSLVFARVSYTMEQVERMVPLLLRLLDRWPWANVSASALVQYVTIYSLPNSTLHYPPIGSSKSTEYNTSIICIDPDTGKPNKLNLHADSSRATAMKIPTIAPNIAFNTSKSKITEKDGPTENLVESYLKFLSSQLHLRVTSLENAKLLRGAYGREYGYDEIRGYGPYNGVDIWRISQEDRARTIVWPTHQLKSDIQGSLPLISVGSTDRVYILPVINAILQTWVSSEDILPAWKNGCRMADSINAAILDGEPSINICSCENPAVSTAVHPCARCLYIARCAEMQQNQQGLGICSRCGQTEEKAPAKRRRAKASTQYLPASTHDGHKVIFISLTNNIHSEASRCGVSSEIASTRIMPAWEDIQRYALTDGQWQDAYCSVRRRGTNTGKNPFQPSPDAIFPYTIVDGEIRYHAPGNIVVTSLYLNFFKYAYIPAMLAHVVKYLKSDRGAMALKDFLGEMANVYLVGMKTPFFKKKRLENVPSDAAYAATRQEWITGLPRGQVHDGARYTRKHYVGNCSAEPCAGWVPEGIDRIANLILQIERRFPAETLRRGPDGCPFPFHEPTMPVDWSWWTCWQMINKRICRMKWWCNKKWDLEDNIETIFLECIWQFLDVKLTDGIFDLPISIYIRHPLRFTVAHRHHGSQLRSAWTTAHPSSIEERDSSKDNMSIEACIVNWAKSDFPEELYPAIKQDLVDNLNIPKEWYDPSQRSQEVQGNAEADKPASTRWGFTKGKKPLIGNFSNGWDDNYTRDEEEMDEDVEIEDEYEDEDEDEDEESSEPF